MVVGPREDEGIYRSNSAWTARIAFALPSASVGAMVAGALAGQRAATARNGPAEMAEQPLSCADSKPRAGGDLQLASGRLRLAGCSRATRNPITATRNKCLTIIRPASPSHPTRLSSTRIYFLRPCRRALFDQKGPSFSPYSDSWLSVYNFRQLPCVMASTSPPVTKELRRKVLRVLFFSLLLDLVLRACHRTLLLFYSSNANRMFLPDFLHIHPSAVPEAP